jgi:hypothetical protein
MEGPVTTEGTFHSSENGHCPSGETIDVSSERLSWTFSQALDGIKNLGEGYAEKSLTVTYKNLSVKGQPSGMSFGATVLSYADPREWLRSMRASKSEHKVFLSCP